MNNFDSYSVFICTGYFIFMRRKFGKVFNHLEIRIFNGILILTCKVLELFFNKITTSLSRICLGFMGLCRICVGFVSVPCWRKNEIVAKRPPRGPRLMICLEIRIRFYTESDGNGPRAQNPKERVENEQRPNFHVSAFPRCLKEGSCRGIPYKRSLVRGPL